MWATALTACATALIAAWQAVEQTRGISGRALPTGSGSGHGHGTGPVPAPLSAEFLPHLLGVAVLAAHAALPLLLLGLRAVDGLVGRGDRPGEFGAVLARAAVTALVGAATALVAVWIAVLAATGGADGAIDAWLRTALPVVRYCFLLGLAAAVLPALRPFRRTSADAVQPTIHMKVT